jgi:hypothetical protein
MEGEVEVVAREIVDLNRIRAQGLHPREYLLAFPCGSFSEDSTFASTDLFAHALEAALAKISLRIKLHLIAFQEGTFHLSDRPAAYAARPHCGQSPGLHRVHRQFPISIEIQAVLVEVDPS